MRGGCGGPAANARTVFPSNLEMKLRCRASLGHQLRSQDRHCVENGTAMMMTKTGRTLAAALASASVATGCRTEEVAPVYQLVPVSTRDIIVSASAAGAIEAVTTVEVKSKASGEIVEVRAEVGDEVQAGDLLVKVDPRVPQNALTQAQADLDVARARLANAESQLRRSEELYQTQSITEQEYETANLDRANANAQLIRAERSVEDARIAFEDTEVRARSTGTIIQRNVEVGTVISSATSNVGGGAVLMLMANLDTVQVRALVDETDIGKLRPGLPVTITVESYPNRPFQGRVLMIEPKATVEQNVTMFAVIARIANDGDMLKPGMNAEVEVHVGNRRGVLAVPNAALRTDRDVRSAAQVLGLDPQTVTTALAGPPHPDSLTRNPMDGPGNRVDNAENRPTAATGGDYVVFVWRNGLPAPVPVRTGLTDQDYSEIVSGLAASDTLVLLSGTSLSASQQEAQPGQGMRGPPPGRGPP